MIERNNNTSDTSEHNIEDISPALSKINKNNGFVVPNGYFEQLSSEIQQRCVNSPKESWIKFVLSSFTKPKYILRYSFILVLLFFGTYFLLQNNNKNIYTKGIASCSINNQKLYADLIDDEDIDESDLTDLLTNNSEIELKPIDTIDNSLIDSNDIINYLTEENDDNNDLY